MRRPALYLILCLTATICNAGDLKLSRTILRGKDADKAMEQSLAAYKPISIVYSDLTSKNKDVIKATKSIITALKSNTILVFVDKTDLKELPEDALRAIQDTQTGKNLPRTVILKPDLSTVVGILPSTYDSRKYSKLIALAKKRIQIVSKKIRTAEVDRKTRLRKAHIEAEKLLRGN